jgi:hypothetical protein
LPQLKYLTPNIHLGVAGDLGFSQMRKMNGKRYGSGRRWGIIEWSPSGSITRNSQVEINDAQSTSLKRPLTARLSIILNIHKTATKQKHICVRAQNNPWNHRHDDGKNSILVENKSVQLLYL